MARYGMVIDTIKCVGCMDCVVACKTENDVPEGFNRDWITTEANGTFPKIRSKYEVKDATIAITLLAFRAALQALRIFMR